MTVGSHSSLTVSSSLQTLTGVSTLNCLQQSVEEDTKQNPAVTKLDMNSANYKTAKTKELWENKSRFLRAALIAPVLEGPGPPPYRNATLSVSRASSLMPHLDGNLSWTFPLCPIKEHWWEKVTFCFTPLLINPWAF